MFHYVVFGEFARLYWAVERRFLKVLFFYYSLMKVESVESATHILIFHVMLINVSKRTYFFFLIHAHFI